jgi:hypothetical protein
MRCPIPILVALALAGCAKPQIAEPYLVAGLYLHSSLGTCLEAALRTAPSTQYKKTVTRPGDSNGQAHEFWVYGDFTDAGRQMTEAVAAEYRCADGSYYLSFNVSVGGIADAADRARARSMVDSIVEHVAATCPTVVGIDHAKDARVREDRCGG